MSISDFLFQGSPPPTVSTGSVSIPNMPDWYSEYLRGLFARTNAVTGENYQPYPGARIADRTGLQQQAVDLTQQKIGAWQPAVNTATATAGSIAGNFNPSQVQSFMSPYMDNVVNRIGTLGARNFNENLLPAVNDQFVGAGQFGSSRHMDFAARALRDSNESITGLQTDALQKGTEAAFANMNNFRQTQLQGAGALGQLGAIQGQLGAADAASLDAAGQQIQNFNQRGLDTAYQSFVDQRNYPRDNIALLNSIVRGLSIPSGTTQSGTAVSPTVGPTGLQQLASLYSVYKGATS
ncbi:hypothetical protein UFOVP435_13 [uncultured Caudovirales phage]|uniref:Uncharacterized protein n=1 Tax=uncultured Caudovirales phage TaxID=2100421 RepID=A0A6J5MAB4_9CAUD|nr:hypothetical protein UFOVP435_13 [uncultured Caudovirales phage]